MLAPEESVFPTIDDDDTSVLSEDTQEITPPSDYTFQVCDLHPSDDDDAESIDGFLTDNVSTMGFVRGNPQPELEKDGLLAPPTPTSAVEYSEKLNQLHQEFRNTISNWEELGTTIECAGNTRSPIALPQQGNKMISMLRILHYCDSSPNNSREFLDGLSNIITEEVVERKFEPTNMPRRSTVMRWVEKQFGQKRQKPTVIQIRRVTTRNPYSFDPACLNPYHLSEPTAGIDTRSRDMLHMVVFSVIDNVKNLFDDDNIFSNLNNLVVNSEDPFLPYVNPNDKVDEILDGEWWPETLDRLKARGMLDSNL